MRFICLFLACLIAGCGVYGPTINVTASPETQWELYLHWYEGHVSPWSGNSMPQGEITGVDGFGVWSATDGKKVVRGHGDSLIVMPCDQAHIFTVEAMRLSGPETGPMIVRSSMGNQIVLTGCNQRLYLLPVVDPVDSITLKRYRERR